MTAITAEWLESVGFEDADGPSLELQCGDVVWLVAICEQAGDVLTPVSWQVFNSDDYSIVPFPNVHTRDDVRALVRMLGGELNESEES